MRISLHLKLSFYTSEKIWSAVPLKPQQISNTLSHCILNNRDNIGVFPRNVSYVDNVEDEINKDQFLMTEHSD